MMAPPTPLTCSVPGCGYVTQEGTPTWESMLAQMFVHTQALHTAAAPAAAQPAPAAAPVSKLEKLPRPTFTLNMSESKWKFTEMQWNNYISQSPVTDETKLMQLQAACNEELRQRVFDSG